MLRICSPRKRRSILSVMALGSIPQFADDASGIKQVLRCCRGLQIQHQPRRILENLLHPHQEQDRKSTRLNSSHTVISYAVFCLKKKKKMLNQKVKTQNMQLE